jgi:anti-sigma regulatory factor (Ser/Thr protein kinase)
MENFFKREIGSLANIFRFISEFAATNGLSESAAFSINLAVEELFTNMVKYNSEGESEISISLSKDDNKVIVNLTDFDSDPFDVTQTKDVDVHQPIRERKVGGLGLHLVRRIVDSVQYEYLNRQSKITLTKNLER